MGTGLRFRSSPRYDRSAQHVATSSNAAFQDPKVSATKQSVLDGPGSSVSAGLAGLLVLKEELQSNALTHHPCMINPVFQLKCRSSRPSTAPRLPFDPANGVNPASPNVYYTTIISWGI